MKFVALALTLLLAVGSQAAAVPAAVPTDIPSQLDYIRSGVAVFLQQVKDSAMRSLDHFDDTEYKQYKDAVVESLDNLQKQLMAAQASAAPYTNAFAQQIMEVTAGIRQAISTDIDNLRTHIAPKRAKLKKAIESLLEEYHLTLQPLIRDMATMHRSDMDALKIKMDPIIEDWSAKVAQNVEETKVELIPIVDSVSEMLTERLASLRALAVPYVDDYKEMLVKSVNGMKDDSGALNTEDLQNQMATHLDSLKEKAGPLVEDIKAKFMALLGIVASGEAKS